MKIKHLLLSAIAVATALVSCQKDLSKEQASIKLSDSEITFESSAADTKTIKLTSNRMWEVQIPEDAAKWVSVSPDSGEASADPQTIEITVTANPDYDRTAEIFFRIVGGTKKLTVSQKGDKGEAVPGDGSLENPYLASEARAKAEKLGDNEKSDKVYVKGIVHKIKSIDTGNYGNAEYYISDNGSSSSDDLPIYRGYYLNGDNFTSADQLKVGDAVVVYGQLTKYVGEKGNPTPQMAQGSELITINGKGAEVETSSAEGLVVCVTARSIVIETADGYAYAYSDKGISGVEIGYKVKVTGKKDTYAGIDQIKDPEIQKLSSDNAVTYPNPTVIGSNNIAAFSEAFAYIKLTGTLSISSSDKGTYYNITVPGSDKIGSLAYPTQDVSSLDGKLIDVEGYFVGWTGSGKYFNIAMVNIAASSAKYFTVEKNEINVDATATSATIKVSSNVTWSVTSETEGFTVNPASGENNGEVAVSFAANTDTENTRTAIIKITTTDAAVAEADRIKTVTIIQGKAMSADAQVINLSAEKDLGSLSDFPKDSYAKVYKEYTINGYTWGFAPSYKYYATDKTIIFGKTGAYIQMPAIEGKSLTKVSVLTGKNASAKVTIGIYDVDDKLVDGGAAINTGKGTTHEWILSGTAANTIYRIKVTNDNNAQFQTITLVYE